MKNNSFDNSIKQQLEAHEAPVPADAWANIQKGKRKRRPWIIFWLLGGLLLCGGMSVYFLNDQNHPKTALRDTVHNENIITDVGQQLTPSKEISGKKAIDTNSIAPEDAINNFITASEPTDKKTTANSLTAADDNTKLSLKRSGNTTAKIFSFNDKKKTGDLVEARDVAATDISTGKKIIRHTNGRFKATIKPSTTKEEEEAGPPAANEIARSGVTEMVVNTTENIPSAVEDRQDSLPADHLTVVKKQDSLLTAGHKQYAGNKMKKPGLAFTFSLSPFAASGNIDKPDSIRRTLETPMNRAEFTATDIRIRRQTAVSFTAMIKKGLSAKIEAGAGVSYTVIKEYIRLQGGETNTVLSVVKRLQNGNQLVDDTLSVTSTGFRSINAVNSYHFLSIPLSLQYQLSQNKKWELALQAGVDINLSSKYRNAIAGKLVRQYGTGNPTPAENKNMGLGFHGGFYLGRELGKRYGIFAAPYLQLNTSKINLTGMPAAGRISRAGIGFGVHYRL